MMTPRRQPIDAITATLVGSAVLFSMSCAILRPYNEGITFPERLEECRLLDRKTNIAGQLNAIGTFLAGGAGLVAGVKGDGSEAYGILSGVFGAFAAWASHYANRTNSRFDARHCEIVLNPDTKDPSFIQGVQSLQRTPFVLDSLKAARERGRKQK
jgi:hypothetical protein